MIQNFTLHVMSGQNKIKILSCPAMDSLIRFLQNKQQSSAIYKNMDDILYSAILLIYVLDANCIKIKFKPKTRSKLY